MTSTVIRILLLLLLLVPGMLRGQSVGGDSIVYRDTLVPSFIEITHTPLRAGFEPMYGRGFYSGVNSDIPEPVALHGCDQFTNGSGNIYGLRFLSQIPLWGDNSNWAFEPSIFGIFRRSVFDWVQPSVGFDVGTSSLIYYNITHELIAKMWGAGIEGRFRYDLASGFSLHGGTSIGFSFNQTYERWQHFSAGQHDRSGAQDELVSFGNLSTKINIIPAISLGGSYEFPLSRKLRAQPSVEVNFPITGITSYWHGVEIVGGVSFLFDLTPRLELVPIFEKRQIAVTVERKRDTIPPPSPLKASIRAIAIARNGDTSNVVRMMIEEVRTRNAYPVLNYIFFEDGESSFPARYVQYKSPEEAEHLFQGSSERADMKLMDLYRETLNILGDRLKKYPKSSVTLIGSTSNTGDEHGNSALARKRAEAVKGYLERVWRIDPKRMKVEATLLPERPSPIGTPEGQAENRRVEFRVEDERLSEPITVTNIEHLATPDGIKLKPHIETNSPILRTRASISAGGVELRSFETVGLQPSNESFWAPTEETLSKLHDSLTLTYDVWDSAGNHTRATNGIPLSVSRVSKDRAERVARFSLILFGFDESRVEKRNEREVRKAADLIPKIPVERLLIQGFTDETGDASHNDELSQERAEGVRKRLEEILHQAKSAMPPDSHTEGRGSRDLLYDNRLPEGRFFSRTVNITIQRAAK